MKSTLVLVVVAMVAAAFSGCIFEETDPPSAAGPTGSASPSPSPTGDGGDGGDGNGTGETPASPPVATINATNVSGQTPFAVTFTLDSSEPDARFLDWSFDANGDGTDDETGYGLPAETTFTYETAGNFTARLTVTDAEGLSSNATLDITVVAPPPILIPDPITFTGTVTGVSDNVGGYLVGEDAEHTFNVSVPLSNITLTFEVGDTAFDLDFTLLLPDGEQAERAADFNTPAGVGFPRAEPPIVEEDPEDLAQFGTWTILVHPYLSFEGEYTIRVAFN